MDYYRKKYKEKIQENIIQLKEDIKNNDSKLLEKINNYCEKFGFESDEILEKIKVDEKFACFFIKDPARQNLYEKIAQEIITSWNLVKIFKKLPPSGKDALWLGKNFIAEYNFKEKNKNAELSKSVDFQWELGDFIFLATHKYTKDEGGAQDNQYKDVEKFVRFSENVDEDFRDKKLITVAICDGTYYNEKIISGNQTRVQYLNKISGKRTIVSNIFDLEKILKENF